MTQNKNINLEIITFYLFDVHRHIKNHSLPTIDDRLILKHFEFLQYICYVYKQYKNPRYNFYKRYSYYWEFYKFKRSTH